MSGKFESLITIGAIVVVAASSAVSLWSGAGLAWPYAALAGVVLTALMIPLALRSRGGGAISAGKMKNIEAKLDMLGRRVVALEQKIVAVDDKMIHYSRSTVRAVASELDAVGAVMRDLAEAVAMHDAELFAPKPPDGAPVDGKTANGKTANGKTANGKNTSSQAATGKNGTSPGRETPAEAGPDASSWVSAETVLSRGRKPEFAVPDIPLPVSDLIRRAVASVQQGSEPPADGKPSSLADAASAPDDLAAVADAIKADAVELMLQAVVVLPQRRVKLYEMQTRVRTSAGRMLDHAAVTAIAADLGLSQRLDAYVLAHAVKVARHLLQRNRDVPVIFNGTRRAFSDPQVFQQVSAAVSGDEALAGRILFRVAHPVFRDAAGRERESLDALQSIGVRFVLDESPDFSVDTRALAMRGTRYIRISADVLMAAAEGRIPVEIHPADLAGFMSRHGVSLIVDGVRTETIALELQEFGTALAQGEALAPARTVRLDVLDGSVEPAGQVVAASEEKPAPAGDASRDATPEPEAAEEPRPRGAPLRAFLRRTSA